VLKDLLAKNKNAILRRWFDLILETYPSDAATLMKKDRDPFTNPVGSTMLREIEVVFRGLCEECTAQECSASLDSILKIRSVQDFSPSKAVGFVLLLKKAIEESLKSEIEKPGIREEWSSFQARIDNLSLQGFDIYVACREKVYEIRMNQARIEKEMALKMMERMTSSKQKRKKEEEN
jgi:hypothetical protein